MQITHKNLSKTRLQYHVELSEEEVTKFFDRAVERLGSSLKVSGFRPGKAPKHIIKQQLSEDALREEAYSLAIHDAWHEVVHSLKTLPIEDPQVDVLEFAESKTGKLSFEFDIRPEVVVKNWQNIALKKSKKEPATDKDVQAVLESLSKGHAQTVLTLEKAKKGDRVEVTFEGSVGGVRKDKLSAAKFPVIIGEATVMPGFEKELLGVKKADKKTFTVTFPSDHYDDELAGKEVEFNLTVDDVYNVNLPKIDNEFGKKFGHDTLEELKTAIKIDLETEREGEYEQARKAEWLAEFEKCVHVDIPQSLHKAEIDRSRANWEGFLAERNIKQDEWLKRRKITLEQLEKDWEKAAHTSVKIGLGLAELAKEQGKELATNDDFQNYLDELVAATK